MRKTTILGHLRHRLSALQLSQVIMLLVLFSGLLAPAIARADISVTTTIRPLQLIAEAVLQDSGEVSTIVKANQSAHQFSISPSDRFALARADIVLWIGPMLESQLSSMLQQSSMTVLTAIEMQGLTLHELDEESHFGSSLDAHLWLDSDNVLIIARELARAAGELDPDNASVYANNLQTFGASITEATATISTWFSDQPMPGFAVYHNAYQYLEKQFGLQHSMELVHDPETQPSIQQIMETRNSFEELQPQCLFIDPDANADLVATLLGDYSIATSTVDPLGYVSTADQQGNDYAEFLLGIARAFSNCLPVAAR